MQLKIGNRIKKDNDIYTVVAVLMSTVYLRPAAENGAGYDYTIKEIQNYYKDIEFVGEVK